MEVSDLESILAANGEDRGPGIPVLNIFRHLDESCVQLDLLMR